MRVAKKSASGKEAEVEKRKSSVKEKCIAIARILILAGWVMVVVLAMELALGYLLIFILGQETLGTPVWEAVYSALSYILAFLIIEFLTPVLGNLGLKWLTRVSEENQLSDAKPGESTKAETSVVQERTAKRRGIGVLHGYFRPANREELGLSGWPTWLDIVFGILGYITTILLAAGATALFNNFAWFDADQTQNLIFSPYIEGSERLIAFVILVLVAPVAEELIFRGWLYGKSRKTLGKSLGKWGSIVLSILIVSVAFGAMHGQWNVGVTVFMLSAVACILRELTGTVYAGMLVHMIQNGMAFYLLYVIGVGG